MKKISHAMPYDFKNYEAKILSSIIDSMEDFLLQDRISNGNPPSDTERLQINRFVQDMCNNIRGKIKLKEFKNDQRIDPSKR